MLAERSLINIVKCVLNDEYGYIAAREEWEDIIRAAQKHGLLLFVHDYVIQTVPSARPDQDTIALLKKLYAPAARKTILQINAVEQMRSSFERMGVEHIFIKGAVTKARYKNDLLRSMTDVDFLYKAEQDEALKACMADLGFQLKSRGRVHDIYVRDRLVTAEAHRELLSPGSRYAAFGQGIWERAVPIADCAHSYEMRIEDEIIFNTVHMASHFKKGGVGIRFLVDAWVYHCQEADWEYIEAVLRELGLDRFYHKILQVAERWFGPSGEDQSSVLPIEEYILTGGLFGSVKNRNDAVISGGKLAYLMRALFPPYRDMQTMFPWLKRQWTLPFAWLVRGIESACRRRDNVKTLLRPIHEGDRQNAAALAAFYKDCGL